MRKGGQDKGQATTHEEHGCAIGRETSQQQPASIPKRSMHISGLKRAFMYLFDTDGSLLVTLFTVVVLLCRCCVSVLGPLPFPSL